MNDLAGPEYHAIISFGLPIEPEDSQYGKYRIKGLDEAGETVWEEWCTTKVQPWKGHKSCLDIQNGATLEDLFVGSWCYFRALPRDSQTNPALEWYLESNAQDASHASIVLTRISPRLARIVFRIAQIIPLRVRVKLANAAQPCLYAAPDLTRRLRAPSRIDSCHTH